MSIIKDIDELNAMKKAFVISIPLLAMIWYVALFLYATPICTANNWYVGFIFAFVFAFIWYSICAVYYWLDTEAIKKRKILYPKEKNYEEATPDGVSMGIFTMSAIVLAICITIEYFLRIGFVYFILGAFGSILLFPLYKQIRIFRYNFLGRKLLAKINKYQEEQKQK